MKYKLEFNFIIYLIGKIISAGVIIGSIPLYIRFFGVESYGVFIFFYTIFLMMLAGSSGWIVQGILRFYTLDNNRLRLNREISHMAFRSFLISMLIMIGVFAFSGADFYLIFLGTLSLYFSIQYITKLAVQQALLKSKKFVYADVIRALIFFITPFVVKYLVPSINGAYALFSGVLLSYILGNLWLNGFKIFLPRLNLKKKTRWGKIFLKYGLPLSIWMFFSPTTNGVDRYIIEASLGTIALAKYTAIFDIIFKVFSSLSIPFNNIVQPLLIQNYNEKKLIEYRKTMVKAIIYLSLIFLVFLTGVLILQDFIICKYLSFCDEQENLNKLIIPFAVSSYIWQLAILIQKNLEVFNRTTEMVIYMGIVVSIVIILGLILVPQYGLISSAYISLLSSIIYFILVLYGTKKHFKA